MPKVLAGSWKQTVEKAAAPQAPLPLSKIQSKVTV
jgi:hypothetical protein